MNKIKSITEIREREVEEGESNYLRNKYTILQWEYFFSFFVGGLILLNHFHHLGWLTGIACLSLSNAIAIVLVRIDVTANVKSLVEAERYNSSHLIDSLN